MSQPRILIIDDEPLMRISIADALKAEGYQAKVAATGSEGVDCIKKEQFNIIISDLRLPGLDGLQVLQTCKEVSARTGVIVITAHGSVETAVEAIKMGAYDYITKPFSMDELLLIVKRLVKVLELEDENRSLREELEGRFSFKGLLGKNEKMREVLEKIKLVAPTDSTVLIVGESGTGKELVANAIHHNSPRRDGAFIKVSCAALPETLLETELFGHERGADLSPAVAGAQRGRHGPGHALPGGLCDADGQAGEGLHPAIPGVAATLFLSRQCPGAGEHGGAGCDAGPRRQRDRALGPLRVSCLPVPRGPAAADVRILQRRGVYG